MPVKGSSSDPYGSEQSSAAHVVGAGGGRPLLPVILGLAFVALGAILIFAYRSGDEDASEDAAVAGEFKTGNTAAPFILPAIDGSTVSLTGLRSGGNVLLFLNEGAT
jgi:hypothetical protein